MAADALLGAVGAALALIDAAKLLAAELTTAAETLVTAADLLARSPIGTRGAGTQHFFPMVLNQCSIDSLNHLI